MILGAEGLVMLRRRLFTKQLLCYWATSAWGEGRELARRFSRFTVGYNNFYTTLNIMAPAWGIEPQSTGLESAVLPLDEADK